MVEWKFKLNHFSNYPMKPPIAPAAPLSKDDLRNAARQY
jgi:hypothetical protein